MYLHDINKNSYTIYTCSWKFSPGESLYLYYPLLSWVKFYPANSVLLITKSLWRSLPHGWKSIPLNTSACKRTCRWVGQIFVQLNISAVQYTAHTIHVPSVILPLPCPGCHCVLSQIHWTFLQGRSSYEETVSHKCSILNAQIWFVYILYVYIHQEG